MKTFLMLVALALASPLAAREPVLLQFETAAPQTFSILVPNAPAIPPVSQSQGSSEQAGTVEAGALKAIEPAITPPRPFRPEVPHWMTTGMTFAEQTLLRTTFPDGNSGCLETGFFPRPSLSRIAQQRRRLYFADMREAACQAGVPVRLFDALVVQESRYHPAAKSPAGAMGLSQLMPGTARYLGVTDPFDARANLLGGARYLREQLDRFQGWDLALAAYNAGPGNVTKYGGLPPFRETRTYVRSVLNLARADIRASDGNKDDKPYLAQRRADLALFQSSSRVTED